MKKNIIISFLLFVGLNGFGQNETHPIDFKQEKCLSIDSNQTTLGMIECTQIAMEEWFIEQNKYYIFLIDTLIGKEKEKLKITQEHWLQSKNKEFEFINEFYGKMDGTMWRIIAAEEKSNYVRERAIRLKGYYETYKFDSE